MDELKLLALDCDGVLTDSKLYYPGSVETSQPFMAFNTRDGEAIRRFQESGVEVALITTNRFEAPLRRAWDLDIKHVWSPKILSEPHRYSPWVENGTVDASRHGSKLSYLGALCYALNVIPHQGLAYVGDTEGDLECLEVSRWAIAPVDCSWRVANLNGIHLLQILGGEGVVYELWENFDFSC